jgi:hypothetical protein
MLPALCGFLLPETTKAGIPKETRPNTERAHALSGYADAFFIAEIS